MEKEAVVRCKSLKGIRITKFLTSWAFLMIFASPKGRSCIFFFFCELGRIKRNPYIINTEEKQIYSQEEIS